VLFLEAKHANAGGAAVFEVEAQAAHAGSAFCEHHDLKYVWVMTVVGPSARLWVFDNDKDGAGLIIPFTPKSADMAEKSLYVDFFEDQRIYDGLLYIKKHPWPADDVAKRLVAAFDQLCLDRCVMEEEEEVPRDSAHTYSGSATEEPRTGEPSYSHSVAQESSIPSTGNSASTAPAPEEHLSDANELAPGTLTTGEGQATRDDAETSKAFSGPPGPDASGLSSASQSSTLTVPEDSSAPSSGPFEYVKVHRRGRKLVFTNKKRRAYETSRKEWYEDNDVDGNRVWIFRGKKTSYYTSNLPHGH
jgi:hypothetical protein